MQSEPEASIPVWQGENPWLFIQRHRPEPMPKAHWHSHIEINYLIDCSMTYLSVGQQIRVPRQQPTLFWAAIPHQVIEVNGSGTLNCVYVSLQEFMRWHLPIRFRHEIMHGGFLISREQDAADLIAVNRWWEDFQQHDVDLCRQALDEIQVRLRRMALAGWRLGNSQQAPVRAVDGAGGRGIAHVEAMAEFIARHYSEPIGVGDVAGYAGLHPNYAITLFKGVIGLSVAEYITRHRLSHAQTLLLTTDQKILAIAMDCGFGCLSRFYDAFRSRLGTTPRQYREGWNRCRSDACE